MRSSWTVAGFWLVGLAAILLEPGALGQTTTRASINSSGVQGDGQSGFFDPAISGDGRLVAFASFATNLVTADTNGAWDVFVHDRVTKVTARVSVDSSGAQGDGDSGGLPFPYLGDGIDLSADAGRVAFLSAADNLVPLDTNGVIDIFVHDLLTGATTRVSVDSSGGEANGASYWPKLSRDGRWVSFFSDASNLVANDTNATTDVFLHDRQTGVTRRVSVGTGGIEGDNVSFRSEISLDGGSVGFMSYATNLVPNDTNGTVDAFVHDVASGETTRVSVDQDGAEGPGESSFGSFSADGRFAGFASSSPLLPDDTNGVWDDYVLDRQTGVLERVNVDSNGNQANDSCYGNALSADGRFIAFSGYASNLVPGDFNFTQDVFLHDRLTGQTTLMSGTPTDVTGNGESCYPALSADGRVVAFTSYANNLVPGDTNGVQDVFVHAPFALRLDGTPAAPQLVQFTAFQASPRLAGSLAVVLLSCTGVSGFGLPNGGTVYLTSDACTSAGIALLPMLSGVIDATGTATTPSVTFPHVPAGLTLYAAAVSYDSTSSGFGSITAPIVITTE